MQRKIFISINISDKIKNRLVSATQQWQNLPVKWVRKENLHITLAFLGYIDDEKIAEICLAVKELSKEEATFEIELDKIELGPDEKEPKFIWLSGIPSEELRSLVAKIEKEVFISSLEKKSFRPHITLGKIRKEKWEALEEKPEINKKFSVIIPVESIDVMASKFSKSGSVYDVIESCPLE